MPLSPGLPQKSVPAEEAHFINTKQLKFLLARSRWQVSCAALWRGRGGGVWRGWEAREGNEAQRAGWLAVCAPSGSGRAGKWGWASFISGLCFLRHRGEVGQHATPLPRWGHTGRALGPRLLMPTIS